ncbi:MAG: homocysteine S-methyltransferase family protein [Phycisphaerae bacterium]
MTLDLATLHTQVMIADGAWSTLLRTRYPDLSTPAELANLGRPEVVLALAREYLAAGARFLTTNTFGAGRQNLARLGVADDFAEINRAGARLARAADGSGGAYVAGSIGPSGRILAIREASEEELAADFAAQASALQQGGADLILFETFSELDELLLALRAAKDATALPVVASLSFDSGPQRTRTRMGAAAGECAAALDRAGADIIGCNCGGGIATALPAVFALRSATARPLWVKPSVGLPDLEDGRPVYPQTPDEFAEPAPALIEAGANILGGCCGAGPEHIRRLAAVVARAKGRSAKG